MKNILIIGILFLTIGAGCTRKAEEKPLEDAGVIFGPVNNDTKLNLRYVPTATLQESLVLNQEITTPRYFRIIDDLNEISKIDKNSSLAGLSQNLYTAFYNKNSNFTQTQFPKSIYVAAGIGEGEEEIQKQMAVISRQLKDAVNAFTVLLDGSVQEFPWPNKVDQFSDVTETLDHYMDWLVRKIPALNISPELSRTAAAAIKDNYRQLRPTLIKATTGLENADHFGEGLQALADALNELKINLKDSDAAMLKKALAISKLIRNAESSQDVLTLVIEVWRLVPAESRERVFKAEAPDLYDFLDGKSETSLNCLEASTCLDPVLAVARRVFVLPKIEETGVQKIRDQIDQAALNYLQKTAKNTVIEFFPQMPGFVKNQMLTEVKKYQSLIAKIQEDMPGFVNSNVQNWAKDNLAEAIPGIEVGKVNVALQDRANISVTATDDTIDAETKSLKTGAETIGLSLSLAQEFLPEDQGKLRAALVGPLLKLFAISGFRQVGGRTFPGFNFAFDGDHSELFNARNLMTGKTTFAVPDAFMAKGNFLMNRSKAKASASVAAQAELLRGLSRQIRFHRDWERNSFDSALGGIQVEDLVTQVPKGAIDFSVFPKDFIFAITLGSAGGILQNIIRDLSPGFLVLSDTEILWGNQYKEISEGKVSTVAGLVDIVGGARGDIVHTADIARYILALNEFMLATDGIEQTHSSPLTTPGEDGKSVLDQIVEARGYLKLFQMGLSNFLVHVAQDKDGGMNSAYRLVNGHLEKIPGPKLLEDQALTIRALMASASTLNLRVYNWAVLDTYFFMNRRMWNQDQQFYGTQLSEDGKVFGKARLPEISNTLKALKDVAPILDFGAKRQLERVSNPWIRALENL